MNQEWVKLLDDLNFRVVVSLVSDNPFIEKSILAEQSGLSTQELEKALKELVDAMVILELASQADSSMESRVPKKIYLVNPEMEEEIKGLR